MMFSDASKYQITHVAGVDLKPNGGMSRVAFHWREASLSRAHSFHHIGQTEVGGAWHYSTFGLQAASVLRRASIRSDALLLHESAAWAFPTRRCPMIVFSHGLEARFANALDQFEPGRKLRNRLFAKLYQRLIFQGHRRADLILVLNSEDKRYLEAAGIAASKLKVFRNGVNPTRLAVTRQRVRHEVPVILFNASWIKRKGTSVLVEAATSLAAAGTRVKWVLTGTGKSTEEVLGDWPDQLRHQVTVVPSFSQDEEALWLSGADVFVLPSYFEGMPLALLQAMESGLPCVTTNCCGQRDVVVDGKNGFLFEPGDSRALHSHITHLVENPELRWQIGQAAAACVEKQSWETVSHEVIDYVMDAIAHFNGGQSKLKRRG